MPLVRATVGHRGQSLVMLKLANLFCLPIVDKLHLKLVEEEIKRTTIIDRASLMISEANCLIARKRVVRRLSIPDRK